MITTYPTEHGTGFTLWGDKGDLMSLCNTLCVLIEKIENSNLTQKACGRIIYIVEYNARHAHCGYREIKEITYYQKETSIYYGFKVDWITYIYFLFCINYNSFGLINISELDAANIKLLNFWGKKAAMAYDTNGSKKIFQLINSGINLDNYVFHEYEEILIRYLRKKPSLNRFRRITQLIEDFSSEKGALIEHLYNESKRLNCRTSELYLDIPNFDDIIW